MRRDATGQAHRRALQRRVARRRSTGLPARSRRPPALAEDPGLAKYLDLRAKALTQRRLPRQRHRVAGHEGQPHRPRDRPDRDLRGQAVRLQGGVRGLRARQGHGMEQAARALRGDAAGTAARPAGAGRLQGRDAGHRLGPERLRRRLLRGRLQRGREDHRRSTCRTTSRCSSRRARAACSSRTRCAPSSTRSWCRSPTS